MMDSALDRGVNFVDTANYYSRGESEKYLNSLIKGRRDSIVLATKVCSPMDDHDPNQRGLSRKHIMEQCDASLERLGTDYIDLYYMHRPDPRTPVEESLRAYDDLISQGKVRYIGTSGTKAPELVEMLWKSQKFGFDSINVEQSPISVGRRTIEIDVLPWCLKYDIPLVVYSPLEQGLFSGTCRKGSEPPPEVRLAGQLGADWWEHAMDVIETLVERCDQKGCTIAQFGLAWVMAHEGVTAAITGPNKPHELEENLKALDVEITSDDFALVDELVPFGTSVYPPTD